MFCPQWFVIVLFLVPLSSGVQCPEGMGCSTCQGLPNDEYEIQCTTSSTNAIFIVKFKPNDWVKITCYNTPSWSEFHLGRIQQIQNAKAISFRMCNLPKQTRLGNITRQIIGSNVEELIFQSYDNLTLTLNKDALAEFKNVKRLTLSSNSLTNVSGDLLRDFQDLTVLNLRENNLHALPADFLNTPNLEAIELGNNNLDVIKPETFEKLKNLKLLNLWNNKLIEIKAKSFDQLTSLMSIDVHLNKLKTLPEDIFSSLSNLKSINLSQNNFSADSLPEKLLSNSRNLEVVTFFENKQNLTTLPKKFFANLPKLKIIKMKRNGLVYLPEDLFTGTDALINISLERNYIKTLPLNIFKDCKNLSTINLSFNELADLPDGIFSSLNKLEMLDLSKNHITKINDNLFDGLSALKVLNMERNGLKVIHTYGLRPLQKLRIAKFSYNELTLKPTNAIYEDEFGPRSPFHHIGKIEELYLAHNNISDIFADWIWATHLRTLVLNHNNIQYLQATDLQFISDNLNVDLTFNQIKSILLRNAEIFAETQEYSRNVIISVENNPITCDCNLYDLLRYREGRMHPYVQNRFHLKMTDLKCDKPEWLANVTVTDLKSETLKCRIDEPAVYNASCPEQCECWMRPRNSAYLIDCSYRGMSEAPELLESPLGHHIEINLTGNYLKKMPSMNQPGYNAVTVLSLSNNKIEELPLDALSKNLEVLALDSNNLPRLDTAVLNFLQNSTKLTNLTLQRNAWICDCNAREFLSFIQTKRVEIPELQKVRCHLSGAPIFEMTPDELCPVVIGWIIGVCIGVALLGIIIGGIAALYYRYQQEIKVWLFARQWCLWLVTEDELDKDKLYDAFISYSHKDEDFVVNNLVPKLEEGPRPFKLCIHYRDWVAGEWIPTQIARSVEDSRRTIVVVSPNFLESIWGRMEFRAAHNQALSEGRARVIVILYGDIGPIDKLDAELKAYLSMNTYVKWGDPWFWEKLRYALPHPDDFTKKKRRRTIFETQNPTIQITNDKSELIENFNINGVTPTAASTPPADTLKTFVGSVDNEEKKNSINESLTKEANNDTCSVKTIANCDRVKNSAKVINKIQCTTV